MTTKLVSVGHLKPGNYIVIEGSACKIRNISVSRPGKHGHAKVRVEAIGLLDGKNRQLVMPGHDNVETPIVDKRNAQILSVSGSNANVMDSETFETFDMAIPDELKAEVVEGVNVLFWDIMGDYVMKQIKS